MILTRPKSHCQAAFLSGCSGENLFSARAFRFLAESRSLNFQNWNPYFHASCYGGPFPVSRPPDSLACSLNMPSSMQQRQVESFSCGISLLFDLSLLFLRGMCFDWVHSHNLGSSHHFMALNLNNIFKIFTYSQVPED